MAADQPTLVTKFAGHDTFPVRYGWPKMAGDGVEEDPELSTRDNAIISLGVGNNMVRSIRRRWPTAFWKTTPTPPIIAAESSG